jgi:hypothetical protein
MQITGGFVACALALLVLDHFVAGPDPESLATRGSSGATRAAAEDRSDPAAAPSLVADRTEEVRLARPAVDRNDPVCVAQRFIDALFDGDVDAAAPLFADAQWNPEAGITYLRTYYATVVRKGYSKVQPGTLRCELYDDDFADNKVVAVSSEGRGLMLLHVRREAGGWSVGL